MPRLPLNMEPGACTEYWDLRRRLRQLRREFERLRRQQPIDVAAHRALRQELDEFIQAAEERRRQLT
jgi:hypothetical protein